MASALPPVGYVTVWSRDPARTVTCLLGPDRPDVTGSYGGWDEVTRPRRPAITTWKAPPSLHLSLSLLLDGYLDDNRGRSVSSSVESQIAALEDMGHPTGSDGEPPLVRLKARGGAVPYQDRAWVIGDMTWGDALMNERGNRTRQQVTLSLYEYVGDVYLTESSAAQRRRVQAEQNLNMRLPAPTVTAPAGSGATSASPLTLGGSTETSTVTAATSKPGGAAVKRVSSRTARATGTTVSTRALAGGFGTGEDLLSVAARLLGDADRWVEIAALNGIRDPRSVRMGQVIRLP